MSQPVRTDGKVLTREQVSSAISQLVNKANNQVVEDLFELAEQIDKLYAELGRLQPVTLKEGEIKNAHDELSAVVDSTAQATFQIIGEAEKLEKLAKDLGGVQAGQVSDSVTRIYEACAFQDITGQRIKKVVGTLKLIENKVDSLIEMLGGKRPNREAVPEEPVETRKGDEALLNGPSMPGQGISQDEIDKLLGF